MLSASIKLKLDCDALQWMLVTHRIKERRESSGAKKERRATEVETKVEEKSKPNQSAEMSKLGQE